ncbi:nitroreductase family protein [Sphingomicrobium sediminis]|uniref:Putative NAD(P)H nitroreductase n=1 Tax=Sphingomicrobium sediminis TaxID=2950949 RepID=A0A9X2EFH5_9SPHN|nr:nitroreductase [Sphingomicrobium sediminis]MCM8556582.1 nitroreductase [Sphingomicrobium sediminis]
MPLNDSSSLSAHLATRRSARPRDIVAPGPSDAQLDAILDMAARTPDHGAIVPYRFVIIDNRDALADLFVAACIADDPTCTPEKLDKFRDKAHWAPTLVALISAPDHDHKIPVWEQELTAGAVGMNLLHATHAHGFVGGWITGAQSYADPVVEALCDEGERIAGFFYLGTPAHALEERARPEIGAIVTRWRG